MVLSFQAVTRGAAGRLDSPLGSDRPVIVCLAPEQEHTAQTCFVELVHKEETKVHILASVSDVFLQLQ